MPNKYNIIQHLIGYLQEFEEDGYSYSTDEFARWLTGREQKSLHKKSGFGTDMKNSTDQNAMIDQESGSRWQFIFMISRLSKCQDFYAKKFFEDLPINTLLEYNFLLTLNKTDVLRKMDIIQIHMVEYTTGIDVLKRLNKLNLVSEFRDSADKRSKRIRITSEGKRVLIEGMLRMNKMQELFLSCIPEKGWIVTLDILEKLHDFHKKIFTSHNSKSYAEIIQQIENQ